MDKKVRINGVVVDVEAKKIFGECSAMKVEVGTTGFLGGERKEGGRTYIHIGNEYASDFYAQPTKDAKGRVNGVDIVMSGDDALTNFICALVFTFRTLMDKAADTVENCDWYEECEKEDEE